MTNEQRESKKVRLSQQEIDAVQKGLDSLRDAPGIPLEVSIESAKRRTRAWIKAKHKNQIA